MPRGGGGQGPAEGRWDLSFPPAWQALVKGACERGCTCAPAHTAPPPPPGPCNRACEGRCERAVLQAHRRLVSVPPTSLTCARRARPYRMLASLLLAPPASPPPLPCPCWSSTRHAYPPSPRTPPPPPPRRSAYQVLRRIGYAAFGVLNGTEVNPNFVAGKAAACALPCVGALASALLGAKAAACALRCWCPGVSAGGAPHDAAATGAPARQPLSYPGGQPIGPRQGCGAGCGACLRPGHQPPAARRPARARPPAAPRDLQSCLRWCPTSSRGWCCTATRAGPCSPWRAAAARRASRPGEGPAAGGGGGGGGGLHTHWVQRPAAGVTPARERTTWLAWSNYCRQPLLDASIPSPPATLLY